MQQILLNMQSKIFYCSLKKTKHLKNITKYTIIKEIKNSVKIKIKLLPYLPLIIIYQML